jgi:hypothetical protein
MVESQIEAAGSHPRGGLFAISLCKELRAHHRGREPEEIALRRELRRLPYAAGFGPSAYEDAGRCGTNQYVGSELIGARAVVV